MTRFLLFLSILGAAIYGLLICTHDVLTEETAEKTYTEQASAQPASGAPEFMGLIPSGPVYKSKFAISHLSTIHSIASSAKW